MPLHASKQLIDIDNASVQLGTELVLNNVSLCIHQGEFIGLIGPNGAGKTTLLKIMLGLLQLTGGTIKRAKNNVGYIPQRGRQQDLQVPLSVLEITNLGGNKQQALHALQAVGMAEAAGKRFADLSGGQQQRVLIAKALACQPQLLILDEPTTGIDEPSQAQFYQLLKELLAKNIAIIMVSHDIESVLNLVTRVVCLNRTILYDGAPEHFEADTHLPGFYGGQHRILHHKHGENHA